MDAVRNCPGPGQRKEVGGTTAATDRHDAAGVEWLESRAYVPYATAIAFMERRVEAIAAGLAPEAVWLLEHPPIYTCGTSASDHELVEKQRFPVYRTGRGGRITYHGPGQRVGYVMLDLRLCGADIRLFVNRVEEWVIQSLAALGVGAHRSPGKIGIWVDIGNGREAKIGAIGIRVRRWISFHGFALNVDPDLSHFAGIVPCGLAGSEVTSLAKLGMPSNMQRVDAALRSTFADAFSEPRASLRAGPSP